MALDVAASRAGSSAAVRRDSRHRLEASVDEWDRRRTLCMRSRRQELGPALRPRRGRQQCRCSSRTRPRKRRRRRGRIAGRALAAPRPRRSECHPRRIAGVAACQGLLLHADSHYVDPVSSRQRVPAPTGLAEHAYTNMHIQQWDLRVIPAAGCAPAAFKRSAMHQARLERVELRQADRLAARAELGQLQDHYHQNDNDQDADNDPNDSTVHFSSFRFACGSDLGNNITLSAHPVLANIFLRVRIRSIHNSTTPRADALHP